MRSPLLALEQLLRRRAEPQRQAWVEPFAERRVRLAPDRDRRLQAPRALLREPHGTAALVAFGDRDLDEADRFQSAQVARQSRLIEPGAFGERAERVVGSGRDLRHQAELGDAETAPGHAFFQKIGDPPRREPARPAGAHRHGGACVTDESRGQGLRSAGHDCMYIQHL